MIIHYGIEGQTIDVTSICVSMLKKENQIFIPGTDYARVKYFSDPLHGVHKKIFVKMDDGQEHIFDEDHVITIDLSKNEISSVSNKDIDTKLTDIHQRLRIEYGSFNEELPEQKMAVRFLTGNEKVLEIGGNIGRNSIVIASILHNPMNLVVLESNPYISNQLTQNRDMNHLSFHIENTALSKKRLIQNGWATKPSDVLEEGCFWVSTITFADLRAKYEIDFDTLVLDCEGAFYYILQDFPEILENIQLIILENDFTDFSHKQHVDRVLTDNHFKIIHSEAGAFGIEELKPFWYNFYEVWKRF